MPAYAPVSRIFSTVCDGNEATTLLMVAAEAVLHTTFQAPPPYTSSLPALVALACGFARSVIATDVTLVAAVPSESVVAPETTAAADQYSEPRAFGCGRPSE